MPKQRGRIVVVGFSEDDHTDRPTRYRSLIIDIDIENAGDTDPTIFVAVEYATDTEAIKAAKKYAVMHNISIASRVGLQGKIEF